MSEENRQTEGKAEESQGESERSTITSESRAPELGNDERYKATLDSKTNRLIIKDSESGNEITLFARVSPTEDDEDEEHEEHKPLTPDEFRAALKKIDELGLTWTADRVPAIKSKKDQTDDVFLSEDFETLQRQYPHLPRELGLVVTYALTGAKVPIASIGSTEYLKKKAEIVRELIISPEYKTEFFFKRSIKVPYLEDVDWEVVFKLVEKNVDNPPGISYALLSLVYHHPSIAGEPHRHQTMTVAVDSGLVDKLIRIFNEIKKSLEVGAALTRRWHGFEPQKGEDSANTKPEELA